MVWPRTFWYYDAKLDHGRGRNLDAMLNFIVLALGAMSWPRASLRLWCKIKSCARSDFDANAAIYCFGPTCGGLAARMFDILMQNLIMCAVRIWRQCWNSLVFGPICDGLTAHNFDTMMQNCIMRAVGIWRQYGISLCWLKGEGLTAHIFDIIMQSWIICTIGVWKQCWNSLSWL